MPHHYAYSTFLTYSLRTNINSNQIILAVDLSKLSPGIYNDKLHFMRHCQQQISNVYLKKIQRQVIL